MKCTNTHTLTIVLVQYIDEYSIIFRKFLLYTQHRYRQLCPDSLSLTSKSFLLSYMYNYADNTSIFKEIANFYFRGVVFNAVDVRLIFNSKTFHEEISTISKIWLHVSINFHVSQSFLCDFFFYKNWHSSSHFLEDLSFEAP